MAQTVFTKALERLCALEGSTQAVASLLRVPERTLERWRAGRSLIPMLAFEKLMRILTAQETVGAATFSLAEASDEFSLKCGAVAARCEKCGDTSFRPVVRSAPLRYTSRLACCGCGEEVVHADLLVTLARQVSTYARTPVGRAKRQVKLRDGFRGRDADNLES